MSEANCRKNAITAPKSEGEGGGRTSASLAWAMRTSKQATRVHAMACTTKRSSHGARCQERAPAHAGHPQSQMSTVRDRSTPPETRRKTLATNQEAGESRTAGGGAGGPRAGRRPRPRSRSLRGPARAGGSGPPASPPSSGRRAPARARCAECAAKAEKRGVNRQKNSMQAARKARFGTHV